MEIKILGTGCAKCNKLAKLVEKIVLDTNSDAKVKKVTDMMEIAGLGIISTPAIVIDNQIKCAGKVPSSDEIKAWLKG